MATYISLMKWTEQGRANIATLPERTKEVQARLGEIGVKLIGSYITVGRYDQVAILEAPDDTAVARAQMYIAGRGNVSTETLRGFDADELGLLISG